MSGWNDYLTERDKRHLEVWGKKGSEELGGKPVLLVIDVYYASVGHERKPLMESIKDWPMSCGLDGWEAIDRMAGVIAAAREQGVPVVYIRNLTEFPSDKLRVAERGNRAGHDTRQLPPEIRALANEIVAEVAPRPGELVIGKAAPSAFAGSPLLQYLLMTGADTVIVCGESTSGCVRASVVDAQTHRYRVGIVEDCCYDRTQASHWINLFDMHQKYGEVIKATQAIDYFKTLPTATPQEN